MIIVEQKPELDFHSTQADELVVEPSDITFQDLTPDTVLIRVKIRNEGRQRSQPTFARLESALLGAFVPWRPLAVLPVPPIEPGGSFVVSTEAARPRPLTLGSFDRIPPTSVLTAISAPGESRQPDTTGEAMLNFFRGREAARRAGKSSAKTSLAPDLLEILGREQPHWAGNINVFVGNVAVERHVAKALRVYAGRPNMAMFLVGGARKPDAYAFEIAGLTADWKAALHDVTNARTLVVGSADSPIHETEWVETAGPLMIMLVVRPPEGCEEGNVAVHVTRQSSQKTAVVEFNLDPAAQGTGCYVA